MSEPKIRALVFEGPNRLRRQPVIITAPVFIICATIGIHVAGRTAALCASEKVDSYIYTVAAYKFWDPQATAADLIPDKPAGQAFLTGWCYRIFPGPPTRLTLAPIESVFLLGGAGMFGWLALRLFGGRTAATMTLFLVIAHNIYNALDPTTDGFDLNESYLLWPMMTAVLAHLTIASPMRRGYLRGLGIGLALTIKQTSLGLFLALIIHGFVVVVIRGNWRDGLRSGAVSLAGLVGAWTPLILFLHLRGWLIPHFHSLGERSGTHVAMLGVAIQGWDKVWPLAPAWWWIALGLLALFASQRRYSGTDRPCSRQRLLSFGFVLLWLAAELVILVAMTKPASHYYQQIVAPVILLAGFGIDSFAREIKGTRRSDRVIAWQWVIAGTVTLAAFSVMPLLEETFKRSQRFVYQTEIDEFRQHIETWDPGSMGLGVSATKSHATP